MRTDEQNFFSRALGGQAVKPPPLWLMRQAGRYLPEYRAVRAQAGSFLNLVYDPKHAAEVTVQPLRRFGFDAAIIFADILVVPHAMGIAVTFEEGEGPRLQPVRSGDDLRRLAPAPHYAASVADSLRETANVMWREGFGDKALIGFAGGPWTVACYAVQGHGKDHTFGVVAERLRQDPEFFNQLIDALTTQTIEYLLGQIAAGAEAIQIFESWASAVPPEHFEAMVIAPTIKIVAALRARYPHIPVIGFPRLATADQRDRYIAATSVAAIQLDPGVDIAAVRAAHPRLVTQGNLDPKVLIAGGAALDQALDAILQATKGSPHIVNLGHGIEPTTPIAHVERLVARIRGQV